jgi:hypothetical protein
MSTLQDDLDDLLEDLADSEDIVDSAPAAVAQPLIAITSFLTSAESCCAAALSSAELAGFVGHDENTYPSAPSLHAIAADCTMLAAYTQDDEIDRTNGWQQRCANHLITIKRLIAMDDGYRDKAGIP